nr:GNAT family N-acetyltransferase [Microbacterium hydrocarbonoxydans]
MTVIDFRALPADSESAARLAAESLTYRVLDTADPVASELFQRATSRGFLGAEPTTDALRFGRSALEARRNIGVYDDAPGADSRPVATIDSWVTPLTVPGGESLPMWAISGVTVSATHRRRGIARALLEGELRAAASAGVPIAGLTVSEATIYGRYGFGSALPVVRFAVDTRRAGWAGPALRARSSTSRGNPSPLSSEPCMSVHATRVQDRSPGGDRAGRGWRVSLRATRIATRCAACATATLRERCTE